ncbi:peptidoglycan glycosyltransferase [Roseburia sp. MUC/MUC-530-WT-4D]|uniref:Peptidoglycan glycosyltransferase n=1 Tax=Roseburia porci TaxID=2605790 RepID=A0A6L5YNJ5_9FIRM|nr:penicillin-binding transpeptidase domain-containing protein [Roseburia porci]MDD6743495.1 penicillin-binding transpeptidase domain-containing protein [Roseburia porci]MST73960.1 peptidoglycan glycosyltransferase [Roseburia porci]
MIYDIKDFLKKFFSSRLFVLSAVMIALAIILIMRVFSLQIVNGAYYQKNFTLQIEETISINASRGNIYDCNGELLAYNELAYAVTITDVFDNSDNKNEELNDQLAKMVSVIRKNGDSLYNDFAITLNSDGTYSYNISGSTLNRFLADVFGKSSYKDLEYNEKFKFNEASATADQIMEYLMSSKNYDVSSDYDTQTAYDIVVIRYAMNANRFSQYKSTTIAQNVSDETVAYMNEHSDELTGVSIEEDTIRKYNYSNYFASIIGYTGKISTDEYDELHKTDDSYTQNDVVGKSGLEQYYESYLRGVNGEQTVLTDNMGKITEVVSTTDSTAGNDVYLSIDAHLQEAAYKLLEQEIAGILYDSVQNGTVSMQDVYFALLNNNVIDINHFTSDSASGNEQALQAQFESHQAQSLSMVENELNSNSPTANNNMSEEMLDYITHIISMLKDNKILLTSEIDDSDNTYTAWKAGTISPKEYLNYCISKQWIDITQLDVDQKYADSSEVYSALCQYILNELKDDKAFSKLVYKYMVNNNEISGTTLCLILFDQGVVNYDEATVNGLSQGSVSPSSFLLDKIKNIEITPAQFGLEPCTGSTVITDVNTGEVKALVSYPGYDNNRLANTVDADYYAKLNEDLSKPLYNYATQERTAPGSTFKMVSSTAGLAEGIISTSSEYNCTGVFNDVSNKPRCWNHSGHGNLNVSEALRYSCNVFFYTVGFNLAKDSTGTYDDPVGIQKIQKYADIYGLDQKSGLEIAENTSAIATQYPVMAAIGQSDNNITTVALSRYVTAVTSGNLYNYQLMNKIVDKDGNELQHYTPQSQDISNVLSQDQWDAIHSGMRMVVEDMSEFNDFAVEVAGKTGTAQQENHPNHALFVGYAPYNNPEVSIATRIAYGYSSHNAAAVSKNILSYYFNAEDPASLIDGVAEEASGVSASND